MERRYGMMEIHSFEREEILHAGQMILEELGLKEEDRIAPSILSASIINKIDPGPAMDKDLYDLPPKELADVPTVASSLEQALEFIDDDELVEITPISIRLRKKLLAEGERRRDERVGNQFLRQNREDARRACATDGQLSGTGAANGDVIGNRKSPIGRVE